MALNSLQYYSIFFRIEIKCLVEKQQLQQEERRHFFFLFSCEKIKAELFRIFNTLNYVAIDEMQNLMF